MGGGSYDPPGRPACLLVVAKLLALATWPFGWWLREPWLPGETGTVGGLKSTHQPAGFVCLNDFPPGKVWRGMVLFLSIFCLCAENQNTTLYSGSIGLGVDEER